MKRGDRYFYFFLTVICLVMFSQTGWTDNGPNHRKRSQYFGVSGGNIKDISNAFCCSGTLGSLVSDGTSQYILSNNHVLARTDQAVSGEDISQPGLIDNGCRPATIVADFTNAVPLGNNVDVGVAKLRSGTMRSDGAIMDIGAISKNKKTPAVGLAVEKSGRTTGLTTGKIGSINASLSVQYQKGCNNGKKFTVTYRNQVVINSSTFSAGGDSGSLIVTNNSCHQPVALLYAGSSSTTVGNPIGEVLTKMSSRLGRTLSFVGGTCTTSAGAFVSTGTQMESPSTKALQHASDVKNRHENDLMSRTGVLGVGVGASEQYPSEAVIVIYMDKTLGMRARMPERVEDVRVKVISTTPFVAY